MRRIKSNTIDFLNCVVSNEVFQFKTESDFIMVERLESDVLENAPAFYKNHNPYDIAVIDDKLNKVSFRETGNIDCIRCCGKILENPLNFSYYKTDGISFVKVDKNIHKFLKPTESIVIQIRRGFTAGDKSIDDYIHGQGFSFMKGYHCLDKFIQIKVDIIDSNNAENLMNFTKDLLNLSNSEINETKG